MSRLTTPLDTYCAELDVALVREGVPAARREQVLAEVVAHVHDTGEDPVDAFGPPGAYAGAYAAEGPGVHAGTTVPGAVAPRAGSAPRPSMPGWAQVVLAVLALVVVLPGVAMVLGLLVAAAAGGALWAFLGAVVALVALVGLALVAHRRAYPRYTWWTQVVVAVGGLGALGAWLTLAMAGGMGTTSGWSECDAAGRCIDHDTSARWLGLHVQDALALLGVVVYVAVCAWFLLRARRSAR